MRGAKMSLVRLGDKAPDFSVKGVLHNKVSDYSLSRYHGKWLVLFFYPADFTFICPTEVVGFSKLAKEFAAQGAEILGVSVDSLDSHRAWAEELGGIDYPLLSDEDKTLSRAMGFSMRGREFHPELLSSSIPAAKSVIWSSATLMSDAASRKLCVC
jgi:alkyl hydroperoxide reductase subunit AhpC